MGAFREYLLSEVRVHLLSQGHPKEARYVIAFRGDVWVFDPDDLHTRRIDLSQVMNRIRGQHSYPFDAQWFDQERRENHAIFTWITQNIMDGFVGTYYPEEGIMGVWSDRANISPTAPMISKVAKALGLKKYYFRHKEYPVDGEQEDVKYHGTAQKFMDSIRKYGLDPKRKESHWQIPEIKPYIYLADDFDTAKSHAYLAAQVSGTAPVVLKIKVPDPSLLVPDFDMDRRSAGASFYGHTNRRVQYEPVSSVDSWKTSKMAGLYGYKGRISRSHIIEIIPLIRE